MKKILLIILSLSLALGLYAQEPVDTLGINDSTVLQIAALQVDSTKAPEAKVKKVRNKKIEKIKIREMMKEADDTLTNEFLDSLNVKKALVVNDYSLIGVQYGVGLSQVSWNPPQEQSMLFMPVNVGVTYTKYGQMFAMPFFAFKAGLFYTKEGYQFEYNEEYDWTYKIEGAEKAILEVVEVPLMFQFHYDTWYFKILAEVGCYGGYRLGITRYPGKTGNVSPDLVHSFTDTDIRIDYGIKGGAGFALVFDPFELHFTAAYKHSLSSLYEPDHSSQYYYRFAYPSNIVISAGIHFQISKRTGKTKAALKKEARDLVYGNPESNSR